MATWDLLSLELERLEADPGRPLRAYPDPRFGGGRTPPFAICMAAWAVDAAEGLYDRFGDDVDLTVGHLHYPDRGRPDWVGRLVASRPPPVDLAEMTVELAEEIRVRSGHDRTAELLVENRSLTGLEIHTNGHLTAEVVRPRTGEVVGTYAGAQHLPLVIFRVAPGERQRIPVLVGTASIDPRLGYAVPPGSWGIEAVLNLGGRQRLTPRLDLTISP